MSAAAAAEAVVETPPKKKLSKKLVIIVAAVVLLLVAAGGATLFVMKQRAAAAAAAEGGEGADTAQVEAEEKKRDPSKPPAFLPMDPFVVNLADRDSERYAQIGITLQVGDAKVAEQLKAYMPAIRNGVLMILAHKTSAELLERAGKEQLAAEIMREAVRPLGIELPPVPAAGSEAPKRPRLPAVDNPVEHVHFSSFIIQ